MSNVLIRLELESDTKPIRMIVEEAFARRQEADLVDRLRGDGDLVLSLVAETDRPVGHVAFSRLRLDHADVRATALAPVAVRPAFRNRGLAAALIHDGLARLAEHGETFMLVLGDPGYYERFGFSCDAARALRTPYDGPHLMALMLTPSLPATINGSVRYAPAFSALT